MKKENFKRWEFDFGNYSYEKFITINFLPNIFLVIDKQFDEPIETEEEIFPAIVQYTLGINWIIWIASISVSFKTNKNGK